MTPEEIIDALAMQEGLPREAMAAAGERREEMIPLYLDRIDRVAEAPIDTLDEAGLAAFLFIYSLLGDTVECATPKLGRNDPRPCGSDKKFKKFCPH